MFLLGGGILSHGAPHLHLLAEAGAHLARKIPGLGGLLASIVVPLRDGLLGMLAGAAAVEMVAGGRWLIGKRRTKVSR
jgi:predicted DNA repair protein MutK